MRLINSREYEQFARIYGVQIYGYLLGVIFLTIVGMIFQSCYVPDTVEKIEGEKKVIKKEDLDKNNREIKDDNIAKQNDLEEVSKTDNHNDLKNNEIIEEKKEDEKKDT